MFRSLIVAPASVREAVMSQPFVAALAARGEVLAVAAHPRVAPVYRAMGHAVAQVYELPFGPDRVDWWARRSVGVSWRRRYDVAYVLSESLVDALVPWFADIPRRVGYDGRYRSLLINERLPLPVQPRSQVARYLGLANERTDDAPGAPVLSMADERVDEACRKHGLEPGRYWVLAPGGDGAAAHCWPPGRAADLVLALAKRAEGPVVLLGNGEDAALAEHIVAQAPPQSCLMLAGATSLDVSMALIAGAAGVVAGDTGWMQLASALAVPQVALFGPSLPEELAPLHEHTQVLRAQPSPDCAPCGERRCVPGHLRCMNDIAVQRVLVALLDQASRSAAQDGTRALQLAAAGVPAAGDQPPLRRAVAGA